MRRFISLWIALMLLLLALLTFSLVGPANGQTDEADSIGALLNRMEEAVIAGDKDTYMSYVDDSDPVFVLEHSRWADDWAELHPVERFDLLVEDVRVDGDRAAADLTMIWVLEENPRNQAATFPAIFRRDDGGEWRYAGEAWESIETEHFIVRYVAGEDDIAETVVEMLPDVWEHTTASLDYTPAARNEIKLYNTRQALIATTLLSLPPISGWNEPGEALKLYAGEATPERLQFVLMHEFTHKLTFDMADNSHGQMPWWLEEGIAQYVAYALYPQSAQDAYLMQSQVWAERDELADWDVIADFEQTPLELWDFVYPQGYAMIRYITETYGEDARNKWIRAMGGEMTLDEATGEVLGLDFDDLHAGFVEWLLAGEAEPAG